MTVLTKLRRWRESRRAWGLWLPLALFPVCIALAFFIGANDTCGRGADLYLWFGVLSAAVLLTAPLAFDLCRSAALSLMAGVVLLSAGWMVFFWAFAASGMSLFCLD
jgi:hypothetical protein